MALPAIVALGVTGLIVWGVSSSAKSKKKKDARREAYGITFNPACTRATIWNVQTASDYMDEIVHESVSVGVLNPETMTLVWLDFIEAPECLNADLEDPKHAAMYARLWLGLMDQSYNLGYTDDAQYDADEELVIEFMDDHGITEEDLEAVEVVVKDPAVRQT